MTNYCEGGRVYECPAYRRWSDPSKSYLINSFFLNHMILPVDTYGKVFFGQQAVETQKALLGDRPLFIGEKEHEIARTTTSNGDKMWQIQKVQGKGETYVLETFVILSM